MAHTSLTQPDDMERVKRAGFDQSAGMGYRLKAQAIKFGQVAVLHLLLRYTQALVTQMSQTAVCNRHHSLDQQLCRWLLLSMDRLHGSELHMAQELIANMLGVRREGVTEAALKLQKVGLIRYSRGRIEVLDRPGLEQRTCECDAVVKRNTTVPESSNASPHRHDRRFDLCGSAGGPGGARSARPAPGSSGPHQLA